MGVKVKISGFVPKLRSVQCCLLGITTSHEINAILLYRQLINLEASTIKLGKENKRNKYQFPGF